jgi:hypothetical protein
MIVLALLASVMLSGCAGFAFMSKSVMPGALYAENQSNQFVNDDEKSGMSKTGEACAQSILGWVTIGDATAKTAARNGGISSVAVVDNKFRNILGIYAEYCIVVHGS